MHLRSFASTIALAALASNLIVAKPMSAQMDNMKTADAAKKPLPSPPATASATLNGKTVTVKYSAPSIRGRKVMGELVPYGTIWRTGANAATTLVTGANLKIGTLTVPAGTYTLYTLPSASKWLLIVNKQTGQWGTEYKMNQDLGRTPMTSAQVSKPQETMSISFEKTEGATTQLHVKWENNDEYVTVTAQ